MGCLNELDQATLISALSTIVAEPRFAEPLAPALLAAVAEIDIGKLAIEIGRQQGSAKGLRPFNKDVGDVAEALVVSALVEHGGYDVVSMGNGKRGIDAVLVDRDSGHLLVAEVKSTLDPSKTTPRLSTTKDGAKQASHQWLAPRLAKAGLENAAPTDVEVRVFLVDLQTGRTQTFTPTADASTLVACGFPFDVGDAPL